jgi:acetyl esterase/lipase
MHARRRRLPACWPFAPLVLIPLLLLTLPGCHCPSLTIWKPVEAPLPDSCEVLEVRDVVYFEGEKPDTRRHQLDLYVPKGKKDFPVLVLVHGGAWVVGDNRCCGLYSSVGLFLASHGIGVALPNYRLSPAVKHPEHIKDVARAVAWTRAHIGEYGGCPEHLFVAGHSAGGHLVSLLATDERYLQAEGLQTTDIRGVISISGVYCICPGRVTGRLGGSDPEALHLDAMCPFRGDGHGMECTLGPGIPLSLNLFGPVFGHDPDVRKDASPLTHVRPGLPPFLLLNAENDLPTLPGWAAVFHEALLSQGNESHLLRIDNRNHNSLMFRAIETQDPAAQAMMDFIHQHCGTPSGR